MLEKLEEQLDLEDAKSELKSRKLNGTRSWSKIKKDLDL